MNMIDLLLIGGFLVVVGFGFFGGVVRVTLAMVALYLGLIVAGFFYMPVGQALTMQFAAMNGYTSEIVAFLLLTTASTATLVVSLFKTFATVRLPNILASTDQIGGAVLGVGAATFVAVISVVVLQFMFSVVHGAVRNGLDVQPWLVDLAQQMQVSFLARFFIELSVPLFALILPWFPNGLPAILVAH